MRCLYCGKQLALLRRLTGGGEFCSDAHKQSYQEEYNRLALSRLLQAQSKPGEIKTRANMALPAEGLGQPLPPGASRHRALSSSSPEPEPSRRSAVPEPAEPVTTQVQEAVQPVAEKPAAAVMEQAPAEAQEQTALGTIHEAQPGIAGFSLELPALAWLPDGPPYVEPCLETAAANLLPTWQVPNQHAALSLAMLLSLDFGPPNQGIEIRTALTPIEPREFGQMRVDLTALSSRSIADVEPLTATEPGSHDLLSSLGTASLAPLEIRSVASAAAPRAMEVAAVPVEFTGSKRSLNIPFAPNTSMARVFPAASPVVFDVGIAASRAGHPASLNGTLKFPMGVAFENSALLDLYPAGIDFPSEDGEVILAAPWADGMFSGSAEPVDENAVAVMEPMEPIASPRQSLEALSRLHQDLAAEQDAQQTPRQPEVATPEAVTVEVMETPAEHSVTAEPAAIETPATTLEVSAEPVQEESIPRPAHELLDIPLKTFAPTKPAMMVEAAALINLSPQPPQLKALPLRPKVAKAPPGFSPQPSAAPAKATGGEPGTKAPVSPARAEVRTKQVPAAKPAAPAVKSAPPQPVKSGQAGKPAEPVKPVQSAKPAQTAKPAISPRTKPATEASSAQTEPPPNATSAQPEKITPSETKANTSLSAEKKAPEGGNVAAEEAEAMPSFATVQPRKRLPFLASLKPKLILAIILVGIAGGVFIARSGKSHAPVSSARATASEDVVGPSIMMGEGGWIQNWGSDVNGSRAGRQITIYGPSLKLSDYRIEFQGDIDTKSMGWVFRALDPYNYYAAKLAIVSPGSSGKFALIKYTVRQGHETEIGRTPLNIEASGDTLFNIRMDVRGSTFRTFVQGQPVDTWTDDRLKSGGVGFLNERAERARIKSVSIFYLSGGKN